MTPATTKRTANDSNTLYDKGSIDFISHSVKSGWGNGKLLTRPLYIVRLGGIGDGFRPKIRSHPMGLLLN
jgi:hypothetical protein